MLTIRVESETRDRIERAARAVGKSLSAFMLEAATKAAAKVEVRTVAPSNARFTGVPTFFRATCATASEGGGYGYDIAGYELARHVGALMPSDSSLDEWADEVERLSASARKSDVAAVLEWFDHYFDRCMALVPPRRRERFAEGVIQFESDKGICC